MDYLFDSKDDVPAWMIVYPNMAWTCCTGLAALGYSLVLCGGMYAIAFIVTFDFINPWTWWGRLIVLAIWLILWALFHNARGKIDLWEEV